MGSLTVTQQIDAPVERVFALATDLANAAEHISGIDRVELLTEGPMRVGTRWRETRTLMGKAATEEMEITAFTPAGDGRASYTAEAESCGCHYWSTLAFTPHGEGTLVSFEWRWQARSLVAKLMSPLSMLMAGTLRKVIAQDLADLRANAERGMPNTE